MESHKVAEDLSRRSAGRTFAGWVVGTGLVVFALLGIVAPASAQVRITGRVTVTPGGEPAPSVLVTVRGTSSTALTDSDGRYLINAASAAGTLVFSRIGLATLEQAFSGAGAV